MLGRLTGWAKESIASIANLLAGKRSCTRFGKGYWRSIVSFSVEAKDWWMGITIDRYSMLLLATVVLASVVPAHGVMAPVLDWVTVAAIALLFFLHGAKLSRAAIIQGLTHWRLHLVVLAFTFVVFPLIGLLARDASLHLVTPAMASGVLFLTLLPSTVQSSIAFTSMAGGNVPAAICSASASNLLGIFLTPLLASVLMTSGGGGVSADSVRTILLELLVPFLVGHLSRPLVGGFVERHRALVGMVDRGSILLIVYTAFSAAVVGGLWHRVPAWQIVIVIALSAVILAIALMATRYAARLLGFVRADEIVIVFCGSKKSLASGIPIAGALFPAGQVGAIILPLMIFHQLQLLACAVIAQRYARSGEAKLGVAANPIVGN